MVVTNKTLRDAAQAANKTAFAGTPFGLKVVQYGNLYRLVLMKRLDAGFEKRLSDGSSREVLSAINALANFATAAAFRDGT